MHRTGDGTLHAINVSSGGVPKLPQSSGEVRTTGIAGDRQNDLRYHGGPDRAVSLYSWDLIQALQAEGHPIVPGSIGENLTIAGLDWSLIRPETRLRIGDVVLEITKPANPCHKIRPSFADRDSDRVSEKLHPGWSRWYARVLTEGTVHAGDPVVVGA